MTSVSVLNVLFSLFATFEPLQAGRIISLPHSSLYPLRCRASYKFRRKSSILFSPSALTGRANRAQWAWESVEPGKSGWKSGLESFSASLLTLLVVRRLPAQSSFQIIKKVLNTLDSTSQTVQSIIEPRLFALFFRDRGVRHDCGQFNERFHPAETLRNFEEPETRENTARFCQPPLPLKGDNAAEAIHRGGGDIRAGIIVQTGIVTPPYAG